MSYNRFQYWVKGPRHRKLGSKYPIERRILNGDFEYPSDVKTDYENQQKDLNRRIEEYRTQSIKKGLREDSINQNIDQIFKKARVTLMKVLEELEQEELERLDEFKEAAFNELYPYMDRKIKQNIWDEILNQCLEQGGEIVSRVNTTIDFYNEYKNRIIEYKEKNTVLQY